jgi:ADP-ribose pyrophosphatase YjhB (NUDIX family)
MKVFVITHYIQRDILRSLSKAEQLRFSELKPQGIENGIFMYHLRQLIHEGLVNKQHGQYLLSETGLRHVSLLTRTNLDLHAQPKLFCLLVIRNSHGEYVMHRRSSQPFINRLTFPGGALFFDENLSDYTSRQLMEKVNIDVPLTLRGLADIRLKSNGQTITHIYAQLFYGEVQGRPLIKAKDERFAPQWTRVDLLKPHDILPDIPDILEQVHGSADYFYLPLEKVVEDAPHS